MKFAQLISLLLFTLIMGVFWGTWFSLSRSIGAISPAGFLEIGRNMIANLGRPMSILFRAAIFSTTLIIYQLYRRRQTAGLVLTVAAVALMLAAMMVTLIVNVPIDGQIREWTTATLPSDWQAIRDRWEFYHSVRTFLSLAAVSCLFGSVLWSGDAEFSR